MEFPSSPNSHGSAHDRYRLVYRQTNRNRDSGIVPLDDRFPLANHGFVPGTSIATLFESLSIFLRSKRILRSCAWHVLVLRRSEIRKDLDKNNRGIVDQEVAELAIARYGYLIWGLSLEGISTLVFAAFVDRNCG